MTATGTRAVIYSRNSSKKQKSIDDQATDNRAACEANGWTIAAELSDPSSASRYATAVRKNWAALLATLSTVDIVVLWEPSRGDRTLASWAAFLDACRTHKVRIHAVTHQRTYDPANARDYRSLAEDGVDSAYESDKTSARTLRGQGASAAKGRPHGVCTYGYLRRYDPATRAFVAQVPHPEHATIVRGIIGAIAAGEAIFAITKKLTQTGVPTPKGAKVWHPSGVRDIAMNRAYAPHPDDPERGIRLYHGEQYVACWPPLVDATVWEAAQRVLGATDAAVRTQRRHAAPGAARYLLSGSQRVLSAPCGSACDGWSTVAGRAGFYACKSCRCVSAPMAEADEYVTRLIVARFAKGDARDLWVADDTAIRAAVDDLARLRAELAEARASYAKPTGGISLATMEDKETTLTPLIADAKRRATPAGIPLAALELIAAATFGAERVRPTWDGFPLGARRELIAGVFARLTLTRMTTRLTRWTPPAERLAIVAERIEHVWRTP